MKKTKPKKDHVKPIQKSAPVKLNTLADALQKALARKIGTLKGEEK